MMSDNQLYMIYLEDYSLPRYASSVKSYYGTMEDIINLMVYLSDNEWTRIRYSETIDAAEYYDLDSDIMHTVAGQAFPILTPVQEICRFETQLDDQHWSYCAYNGALYPCYASRVDVCQSLIRTESGYERCLKACLSGLNVCHHGIGWACPNDVINGFPGAVTWDGEHHTLNLFISQAHYEPDELATATADVANVSCINLSAVMADILAEG